VNLSANFRPELEQIRTFRLLVGFRWVSLLLPVVALVAAPSAAGAMALAAAIATTLTLTLSAGRVNQLLLNRPALLALDLLLVGLPVWLTGVEHSPYYLYSLSPILAAAFFFDIRGGVLAAAGYTFIFGAAFAVPRLTGAPPNLLSAAEQAVSFFLIGAIFGYPARLLRRLNTAHTDLSAKNRELTRRNRDLNLVRELSLVMQSSADPAELQESILQGLIQQLGYRRAVIGLYDEGLDALSSWLTLEPADSAGPGQMAHTDLVSLVGDSGPVARSVKGKLVVEIVDGQPPTATEWANRRLVTGAHYIILPLRLRQHTIGVMLIDDLPPGERLPQADRLSLDNLATHAGVALGSMRLCIDRAQQVAISEERHRIASGLHDNVSQILYGLAYGLDACTQMLPGEHPARPVLGRLHGSVTDAQALIRQAIFSMRTEDITSDAFVGGLHRSLRTLCPAQQDMALRIDLPGNFDPWPAAVRNGLFQVAQEAVTNAAKHSAARQVVVKLIPQAGQIEMRISDNGDGFDPAAVDGSRHLGLHSMRERVESLGGTFEVTSTFGEGTLITVRIPNPAETQPAARPVAVPEMITK